MESSLQFAKNIGKVVPEIVKGMGQVAQEAYNSFYNSLPEGIKTTIDKIVEFGAIVYNYLAPKLSDLWNTITTKLIPALSVFWQKYIQPMIPVLGGLLVGAIGLVIDAFKVAAGIISIVINVLNFLQPVIGNIITFVAVLANSVIWLTSKFLEFINWIVSGSAWESFKNILSNVASWFKSKFEEAWTGIKNVFSNVGSFFGGIWNTIKEKFTYVGTQIGNAVGGAFKSVINGVLGTVEGTINWFIDRINDAIGLINKIPGVNIGHVGRVSFGRLYKGGYANANTPYLVGENPDGSINKTTEMFVPKTSGTVINAKNLQGMLNGGGRTTTIGNIYLASDVDVNKFIAKLDGDQEIISSGLVPNRRY